MNAAEFDQWTEDLGRKFPAIRGWMLRDLGAAAGPMLADWFDVLAGCELADALAVNRRMLAGDDDGPGKFASDWQELPARIRRMAMAERWRRAERERPRGVIDWKEPRYRCLDCRDTGYRMIASDKLFEAWLAGKLTECRSSTCAVRCGCQPPQSADAKRPDVVFNAACHFPIPDAWPPTWQQLGSEKRAECLAEFSQWAAKAWDAWQNRRRHAEFDRFNNRAFA